MNWRDKEVLRPTPSNYVFKPPVYVLVDLLLSLKIRILARQDYVSAVMLAI
jgi:hypothetical protein